MDDVVAALLKHPIERHRKARVEAALDDVAARLPDAPVQGAGEPRPGGEVRVTAITSEVFGELHCTHLGAAAIEASEDMQDPEWTRPPGHGWAPPGRRGGARVT